MKTFDKKDVITCINAEDAKKYVGKLGYFANGLNGFANIDYFAAYSLDNVQVGIDKPFFYREKNFALFLPEDKVKEVEESKKYRPFKTLQEFKDALEIDGIGDWIQFRFKDEPTLNYFVIFNGYVKDEKDQLYGVCLGSYSFSIQHLFEHFEYSVEKDQWKPFGVEE